MTEPEVVDGLVIRAAGPADAVIGADFHRRCWQQAYAGLIPAASLAAFTADVDQWRQRWRDLIAQGPPRRLAFRNGVLVGFSCAGPDPDDPETSILHALYVSPQEYGSGLAQTLLDLLLGDEPAVLRVLESNGRARSFYARNGFLPTGTVVVEPELGVPELELRRPARGARE